MNPFVHPPLISGLFQNKINMKKMLNCVSFGIVILDQDLNVVFFNTAAESITGENAERSYGIPCRYFLKSRLCQHECPIKNNTEDLESKVVETNLLNADRQIIPARISFSSLKDENDEKQGYILCITDLRTVKSSGSNKGNDYSFSSIIGKSPQMEKVYRLLPVLAQSDASILITGETGTGKDLLAEELHKASERSDGPFIKVNCGALPETLLESELFGHNKGAFTGAVENKPGRFKLAHNGTLFLTEIGDLPLTLQVKLLTFLDDKVVYPLGSTKGFQADVRVIAATHRDLEDMVRQGKFRQDLLFRLNVARIHLPPLREREDDIFLLLNHFLKVFNQGLNKNISGFSDEAKKILLTYSYYGNVREIRNIMEYAANVCQHSRIVPEDLPAYILGVDKIEKRNETYINYGETNVSLETKKNTISRDFREQAHDKKNLESFSDIEKQLIVDALLKSGGNKSKASDLLGWGRTTLWRKMKKYNLG